MGRPVEDDLTCVNGRGPFGRTDWRSVTGAFLSHRPSLWSERAGKRMRVEHFARSCRSAHCVIAWGGGVEDLQRVSSSLPPQNFRAHLHGIERMNSGGPNTVVDVCRFC